MSDEIQKTVLCFLINDNKILLLERTKTWFESGKLCPPGGNVDAGEDPKSAAVRELYEETGLIVQESDVTCIKQYQNTANDRTFDNYYYLARAFKGTALNKEPDRHKSVNWYPLHALPNNTSDLVIHTLKQLTL